jgi:hypothetical protein
MSHPSIMEMEEYASLREEFKHTPESNKHPRIQDLTSFSAVISSLGDDATKIALKKCIRYNRYLELRVLVAPYLYDKLLKHGIKP